MEKDSAHAPDVELCEKIEFEWSEFSPVERIKAGITEIFLGLVAFAALVAFCRYH